MEFFLLPQLPELSVLAFDDSEVKDTDDGCHERGAGRVGMRGELPPLKLRRESLW